MNKIGSSIDRIINKVIMFLGYVMVGMISVSPVFYLVRNLRNETIALAILSPFWIISIYLLISFNGFDHSKDNLLTNFTFFLGLFFLFGIVVFPLMNILF